MVDSKRGIKMFVEYMAIGSKEEAEQIFDAAAKRKPAETDEIYLVKEQSEYQIVLKSKKKKAKEQRWSVNLEDKGVRAKRVGSKEYFMEQLAVILSGVVCIVAAFLALFVRAMAVTFIWIGLVFLLLFLFITWRRFFQKSIALKIYLIRMI